MKSWKFGKLHRKIWLFVPTPNFGTEVSPKRVTVLVVFTFTPLLKFYTFPREKHRVYSVLVWVLEWKTKDAERQRGCLFMTAEKDFSDNCTESFSWKPAILHDHSVGFAQWFQQSCNASLVHLKKNKNKTNIVPKKVLFFFKLPSLQLNNAKQAKARTL